METSVVIATRAALMAALEAAPADAELELAVDGYRCARLHWPSGSAVIEHALTIGVAREPVARAVLTDAIALEHKLIVLRLISDGSRSAWRAWFDPTPDDLSKPSWAARGILPTLTGFTPAQVLLKPTNGTLKIGEYFDKQIDNVVIAPTDGILCADVVCSVSLSYSTYSAAAALTNAKALIICGPGLTIIRGGAKISAILRVDCFIRE